VDDLWISEDNMKVAELKEIINKINDESSDIILIDDMGDRFNLINKIEIDAKNNVIAFDIKERIG
jgi:hypothetical protein